MKICPNCGRELGDGVKFCTGCGTPLDNVAPASAPTPAAQQTPPPAPTPEPAAQPAPPKEKKPIDFTKFNQHFWMLYIVVGVMSYLLVELGGIYAGVSAGFTIVLGVLAIVFAVGFVCVAVVHKIAAGKMSDEDKAKYAMRDNICLAISAVIFIYVLLAAIGLFNIAHNLIETQKMLDGLAGMM